MTNEKIQEYIKKYRMEIGIQNGQEGIRVNKKPSAKEVEEIKANKPAILAELHRRADGRKAAELARKEAQEKENRAIEAGETPIELHYYDGEYLSGYMVFGHAAKLLVDIGIASEVNGWGTHVSDSAVNALGTRFTYPAAVEYTRPAREAEAAKKAAKEAERNAKFAEAKDTGKPVLLRKWITDCCDPREECSLDTHAEYAMPNGSTKTEWHHTW